MYVRTQSPQNALAECPLGTKPCEYPQFTIPPSLQGPSGEKGQILLEGITTKVSLYHGFWTDLAIDREMDWHVHIKLPPDTKQALMNGLKNSGCVLSEHRFNEVYSEHMVLDSPNLMGDDPGTRQLGFRSADVSLPLRLFGSSHPAFDLGLIAARHQNKHRADDFSKYSRLVQDSGCSYLQGAFVNDEYHKIQLEIHPLDSIAFAMEKGGKTIPVRFGTPGWPTDHVRWRVAFFTNSTLHRVNKCSQLQKERTTTWFLGLPSDAVRKAGAKINVVPIRHKLWNGVQKKWYESRGVKSFSSSLQKDPKDGLMKLKVTATMHPPDKLGGIFVRDFVIQTF